MDKIFLQFVGSSTDGSITIPGQVTTKTLTDAIEVRGFSLGIANPVGTGSGTSGAGAGKVQFSSMTLLKAVDVASTSLFEACASGAHFPKALLSVARMNPAGQELVYLQYAMSLVFVTGVDWSGSMGESSPAETVTLEYGALQVSYKMQTAGGAPTGSITTGGWNQITNQPTTAPILAG